MVRKVLVGVMAVMAGVGIVSAQGTDTDVFTITLTPAFTYDIMIATHGADSIGLSVDTLDHVYYSTSATNSGTTLSTATIYNNGNVSQDWTVAVALSAASGDPWKLGSAAKDTVAVDSITLCVVLEDIADGGSHDDISEADFDNTDLIAQGQTHDMDNTHFLLSDGNEQDSGNNVAAGEARIMWYRIRTPQDISNTSAQTLRFTMIAASAGTF